MVAVFFAQGTEEIEALTQVDVLRRAGVETVLAGVGGKTLAGSHGIVVQCDMTAEELPLDQLEMVVLPGGLPGAHHLNDSPAVQKALDRMVEKDGWMAAICAAPLILGRRGLVRGKKVTCYPGFEGELTGGDYTAAPVERDGRIITGNGPGAALAFGLELVRALKGDKEADSLGGSMQWRR